MRAVCCGLGQAELLNLPGYESCLLWAGPGRATEATRLLELFVVVWARQGYCIYQVMRAACCGLGQAGLLNLPGYVSCLLLGNNVSVLSRPQYDKGSLIYIDCSGKGLFMIGKRKANHRPSEFREKHTICDESE